MLRVVHDAQAEFTCKGVGRTPLDEIIRDSAQQMLVSALTAEATAYIAQFADQVDDEGRRLVVRNGYHEEREVLTAAGAVTIRAPRVNDRRIDPDTGQRRRFSSAILPAWVRTSPQMTRTLPLLYLYGLATKDFAPALEQFAGSEVGLSVGTIIRLTGQWQQEAKAFAQRSLSNVDYSYVWVDAVDIEAGCVDERACLLLVIGVRPDGSKELVALTEGCADSGESWAGLLHDCRRRGMSTPPMAVGDSALGFWNAVREVLPVTEDQRRCGPQPVNILSALPDSGQDAQLAGLRDIYLAKLFSTTELVVEFFHSGADSPKEVAQAV